MRLPIGAVALVALTFGCGSGSTPATSAPSAAPSEQDAGWTTRTVLGGDYTLDFPAAPQLSQKPEASYTAFKASETYQGRLYWLIVHRYPAGSADLSDPTLLDRAFARFANSMGAVATPASDLPVGHGLATGRTGQFSSDYQGQVLYHEVVVCRVHDDVLVLAVSSQGKAPPKEDLQRMADSLRAASQETRKTKTPAAE